MIFWLKTLRDSKVRIANDHGKKFQSGLAASFRGIIHCCQDIMDVMAAFLCVYDLTPIHSSF